jgi:hypothetical protein
MLYSEKIAVCSQIHTKHINTLCGQNVPRSKPLRVGYRNQSVAVVQWNNRCLFSDPHKNTCIRVAWLGHWMLSCCWFLESYERKVHNIEARTCENHEIVPFRALNTYLDNSCIAPLLTRATYSGRFAPGNERSANAGRLSVLQRFQYSRRSIVYS